MKIGFSKKIITPALPVQLSGYAQKRIADKVRDDLFVKVIVYQKDNDFHGIISYDLIAFDELYMNSLEKELNKIGLPIHHFIVAATHTHSGPGGTVQCEVGILKGAKSVFMEYNQKWISFLIENTIDAIQEAIKESKEAKVYIGQDTISNVGSNRNDPSLAGDSSIFVAYVEQVQGQKVAIVNYACHPTVLNATNTKVSADLVGELDKRMNEEGYAFTIFLNGCCGDISTRFTRSKPQYEEVERFGILLKDKVIQMSSEAKEVKQMQIKQLFFTLPLILRKSDDPLEAYATLQKYEKAVEEAKKKGIEGSELRVLESFKEGAQSNVLYAKNAYATATHYIMISIHQINEEIFVCMPGEMFSQLSNTLQDEHIHFICYANGYNGYFADEEAYDKKYYEALSSSFEKGQSEKMMVLIKDKITKLQLRKGR